MFSIIVPYFDPEYKKTQTFTRCLESIIKNSHDYELIIVKDGPSYVESHNKGLSNAHGDYLVVVNDDIVVSDSAWLDKLADSEAIVSWRLGKGHMTNDELPDASCFAMSRATFNKLGLMNENFKDGMNYEDTDYFLTAKDLGISFKQVDINMTHSGYETAKAYSDEESALQRREINRAIFFRKWLK